MTFRRHSTASGNGSLPARTGRPTDKSKALRSRLDSRLRACQACVTFFNHVDQLIKAPVPPFGEAHSSCRLQPPRPYGARPRSSRFLKDTCNRQCARRAQLVIAEPFMAPGSRESLPVQAGTGVKRRLRSAAAAIDAHINCSDGCIRICMAAQRRSITRVWGFPIPV
jgi:hypothetical protein